jgi:hypothetical protein
MPGLKLVLPTLFSDSSLPILRDDPILPMSGALFLGDVSMIEGSGIPGSLYNIAGDSANSLTGGNAATMPLAYAGAPSSAQILMERSTKGGIHGILSHASAVGAGQGFAGRLPAAVLDYIFTEANRTHAYYYSLWSTPTRYGSQTAGPLGVGQSETTGGFHVYQYGSGAYPSTADRYGVPSINYASVAANLGKPHVTGLGPVSMYRNAGAGVVTDPGPLRENVDGGLNWGRVVPPASAGFNPLSWVFYRLYIEDLTVSGRTFAQVKEKDLALYNAAFGVGGRFEGDTFSAPATALP